jgi:splicing factor 3A subunit 1
LERVVERWSYERSEREKKERERADTDKMQQMYMSVDWHDFVLVETIDFPEDEALDASAPNPLAPPSRAPQEEVEMEMEVERVPTKPLPTTAQTMTVDDEDEITVVRNYRPDVSSNKSGPALEMIDPITGRSVPASEMSEHMRISLLDPKWRSEQQRLKEKTAQDTLAEGNSIASALQSFAKQRGDIFGSTEEEEEAILRERAFEQSKDDKLVWDGTSASASVVQAQSINRLMEHQTQQFQQFQPPKPTEVTPSAPMPMPGNFML